MVHNHFIPPCDPPLGGSSQKSSLVHPAISVSPWVPWPGPRGPRGPRSLPRPWGSSCRNSMWRHGTWPRKPGTSWRRGSSGPGATQRYCGIAIGPLGMSATRRSTVTWLDGKKNGKTGELGHFMLVCSLLWFLCLGLMYYRCCWCFMCCMFWGFFVPNFSGTFCVWMRGIIVEVVRVSMCRFRFKFYQAVVQRCRIICFKFMYWLRLGAVVPVWFCISLAVLLSLW